MSSNAFQNGKFIPVEELSISPFDAGFVNGVVVAEQMRTFKHQIFLLEEHLDRFFRGLKLIRVQLPFDRGEIGNLLTELVKKNLNSQSPDIGICFFATPGIYNSFDVSRNDNKPAPTFSAFTYSITKRYWSKFYETGAKLVSTNVQDVSAKSWPRDVKIRSRLHYYLANLKAQDELPNSFPILFDENGFVSDSSIASVITVDSQDTVVFPKSENAYASISVQFTTQLCSESGKKIKENELTLAELKQCKEVILASTPWCLLPVQSVDDQQLRTIPGPITRDLTELWIEKVGLDFVAAAQI